jgi:hypothetical protein
VTYYVIDPLTMNPKPNCGITILIRPVVDMGGHCHGGTNRPVGTPVAGTYSGTTGPTGLDFQVPQVWPEVSGLIAVNSSVTPDGPCFPTGAEGVAFLICVRGPDPNVSTAGLTELPDPGPGYELRHGPDNQTRHPDHFYGTPNTVSSLLAIAAEWGGGAVPGRPLLQYNDIGLRWGGVFDILTEGTPRPPDWTPPHCGHRNGRTMDFRFADLTNDQRLQVRNILQRYFDIGKQHTTHWHVNLKRRIPD